MDGMEVIGDQGDTLTGAWVYPGGGGYATTATRVRRERPVPP
jgi:hypothetical protein